MQINIAHVDSQGAYTVRAIFRVCCRCLRARLAALRMGWCSVLWAPAVASLQPKVAPCGRTCLRYPLLPGPRAPVPGRWMLGCSQSLCSSPMHSAVAAHVLTRLPARPPCPFFPPRLVLHTVLALQGAYTTFAMCGFVRQNGAGDAALTRLWDEKQRGELRGQ